MNDSLFDTPLTVDSSDQKWELAMKGSMQLAEMVQAGYFFTPSLKKVAKDTAVAAAHRITYSASRLERSHWHANTTSRDERARVLPSLLEGDHSSLHAVNLSR